MRTDQGRQTTFSFFFLVFLKGYTCEVVFNSFLKTDAQFTRISNREEALTDKFYETKFFQKEIFKEEKVINVWTWL